jgi:hypothetical protein
MCYQLRSSPFLIGALLIVGSSVQSSNPSVACTSLFKTFVKFIWQCPRSIRFESSQKTHHNSGKKYRKYLNSHYSRILKNPRRTHLKLVSHFEVNFKLLSQLGSEEKISVI